MLCEFESSQPKNERKIKSENSFFDVPMFLFWAFVFLVIFLMYAQHFKYFFAFFPSISHRLPEMRDWKAQSSELSAQRTAVKDILCKFSQCDFTATQTERVQPKKRSNQKRTNTKSDSATKCTDKKICLISFFLLSLIPEQHKAKKN